MHKTRARIGIALTLAALLISLTARAQAPQPVVLLIVVDTLRADRLGCYGHTRPTSPGLDRWSERAAIFDHAFAPSGWTAPSVGSILTGCIPPRHGFGARKIDATGVIEWTPLGDALPTLAERMAALGFRTAGFVTNPFLSKEFGAGRGFHTYSYGEASNRRIRRADTGVRLAWTWLERHPNEATFVFLHMMDPHMDYDPPKATRGRFTGGLAGRLPVRGVDRVREEGLASAARREFVSAAYDEEVCFVDMQITRLLDLLENSGRMQDAIVIVTSDHGEEMFEHGGFEHGHSLHQEILRVPLMIWAPSVRAGRYDTRVSLVDILPTVLEGVRAQGATPKAEAKLSAPSLLDGISLWPLITEGKTSEALEDRSLLVHGTYHGAEQAALVDWPHKLILPGDGPPRLYHLVDDPGELDDRADDDARRTDRMRADLEERIRRGELERRSGPITLDAETLERLRSLGYTN